METYPYYFSEDGTFGDADTLLIAPTAKWTDEDWEQIENCPDSERRSIAYDLLEKYGDSPIY